MTAYVRKVEVVTFRTTWELGTNKPYWYGAIKVQLLFTSFYHNIHQQGGDTTQNHQDLDLGQFVLEKNGQRFAIDLGADNYSLPNYFSIPSRYLDKWLCFSYSDVLTVKMYMYYRTNTSGHNALVFNTKWTNQAVPCLHAILLTHVVFDNLKITQAYVKNYTATSSEVYAEIDLSSGYAPNATNVTRSLLFNSEQGSVTINDKVYFSEKNTFFSYFIIQIISNSNTHSIFWRFHTQADVYIDGNQVNT